MIISQFFRACSHYDNIVRSYINVWYPGKISSWLFPNFATRCYANHAMFMQNSCHEHEFFCLFMPMNSDFSCFWSLNNGLCAWSKGMTSCAWEKDSCAWNIGLKPLFTPSSYHEHGWTWHEHGMKCAWSYYDCGHKKHEIWAEIPKFHGCC